MKRVAFIGGSGFVGTRLIDICRDDFDFINIDKRISDKYPEDTKVGNVLDLDFLKQELAGIDLVVLLAAEHRDDVSPTSLYYEVNVQGTKNVSEAMSANNVKNIIFTSSVAVYGLNKDNPNESHPVDPFNHYGKSKWQAEEVLQAWHKELPNERSLTIVRPTVIFGERNRGNVYNLLKQIASGRFLMVGSGKNKKSMTYVGNVVAFLKHRIQKSSPGLHMYNYVNNPDLDMNQLVEQVEVSLEKKIPAIRAPYWIGLFGGIAFDVLSKLTKKKFPVSAVRVKKFCATTQFDGTKAHSSEFRAPYTLNEGLDRTLCYEFKETEENDK